MLNALRFSIAVVFIALLFPVFAESQIHGDVYFGMGTARDGPIVNPYEPSVELQAMGGLFGTFGGAVMLNPNFGVGAEILMRFRQGDYGPFKYRPIFYDFNGIWIPRISDRVRPEFQAGFGGVHLRFYDPRSDYYDYNSGQYSNYLGSTNHLQLHAAAGLRIFIKDHIFIRPQVDYRWVRNLNEFSSNSVLAYTLAIGFSSGD